MVAMSIEHIQGICESQLIVEFPIPLICKRFCGKDEPDGDLGKYCIKKDLILIDTSLIWKKRLERHQKNCPRIEDDFAEIFSKVVSHEYIHKLCCPDEVADELIDTLEGCVFYPLKRWL